MAYCGIDDVLARSARIAELVPEGYDQADWLHVLIDDGAGLIDSKLAEAYNVPLTNPPPCVKTANVLLVLYLAVRENYSQENVEESGWARSYYDDAMAILDAMLLHGPKTGAAISNTTTVDRTITRSTSSYDGESTTVGTWERVW